PEYAVKYIRRLMDLGIEYRLGTMVLSLDKEKNVTAVSAEYGLMNFCAKSVILAMGCRERTRGALNIPGTRPAGVYTAGTAQYYVNILGKAVGKRVVILGSGDIGLIMARRLTLEGAKVLMVCELMPYSNGLGRNIAQCLEDFDIPLRLSHTVTGISGSDRVTAVTVSEVGSDLKPIPETEETVECDTLLLSVGLIPENELTGNAGIQLDRTTGGAKVTDTLETSVSGIFACGNVLHVHDLVDYVSDEASRAGAHAADYINGKEKHFNSKVIRVDGGVRYVVPQSASDFSASPLLFRVAKPSTGKTVAITADGVTVYKKKTAFLTPSEMQRIDLKSEVYEKLNEADDVCLTLLD
ncbi:MAG TPA: FAD-dependent oxidoreductase, partial [Bacillota bacterium]|nr:FAD-dependent oxidoreductase [Bacillota bacterium]